MNGVIGPEAKSRHKWRKGCKRWPKGVLFLATGFTSYRFCRIEAFAISGQNGEIFMNGAEFREQESFWMEPHTDRSLRRPIAKWPMLSLHPFLRDVKGLHAGATDPGLMFFIGPRVCSFYVFLFSKRKKKINKILSCKLKFERMMWFDWVWFEELV